MVTSPSTIASSSDHGDPTFDEALQIDMKGLVGDAVGNMSISPTNRNVVLAARKGLFIIDLDASLEVPRFLPQGGTWDVADVQWNPHLSHANYIVSTSSEKLLIWNLLLGGKTSIEHILHSHYRAITDINWHTSDPNLVVSTGIDAWLWAWDLRVTQKPVLGLCAFNGAPTGGTQVKWNRQDENILASSHMNQILIWDRRKGSLPISSIEAHAAKIYGIDWSHDRKNEIVTCSLDRTIKVFDVQTVSPNDSSVINHPKITFQTSYPVWRARNLPFGRGILSLPQRGENALEMYVHENPQTPIQVFEGHTDVVKEFVWRRGGQDWDGLQLITWSKDKTLRFWPIDPDIVRKMGSTSIRPNPPAQSDRSEYSQASSHSSIYIDPSPPPLSAPVGHILAEVRAFAPTQLRPQPVFTQLRPRQGRGDSPTKTKTAPHSQSPSAPIATLNRKGSTMTRGNVVKKPTRMDTLTWWSSVKVGERKEGSSEADSGDEGGVVSRVSSISRRNTKSNSDEKSGVLRRTDSKVRVDDEIKENEVGQSLQDEITHVITKLAAYKIRLEKHDLTKKRTCTLGLHGPWGEKSSVFIRITFTFPKDYPQSAYPNGTPTVELERNPLISLKDRAFMLRRLRVIRETCRPCLEACLRFLLFGNEGERGGRRRNPGSSSSDEDEDSKVGTGTVSSKDEVVPYLMLRNDKNLAEPRTSQGVFGPNGELVCFSRAPPRIVRNPLHDISMSPSIGPHQGAESVPRLFRSPALLSDAINQLTLASNDRASLYSLRKPEDATNILRIMTNLLTFSKRRRLSERTKPVDDTVYSLLPTRRSTVFIKDTSTLINPDRQVASDYILDSTNPRETCQKNAVLARRRGRFDHERAFQVLKLFAESLELDDSRTRNQHSGSSRGPAKHVFTKLYDELCVNKDVQMLAMMSIILLHFDSSTMRSQLNSSQPLSVSGPTPDSDYFSRSSWIANNRISPALTGWYRAQSPPNPRETTVPSPPSSRGSWSSIFNTGSMRHLMTAPQEAQEITAHLEIPGQIPVPGAELSHHQIQRPPSDAPLKKTVAKSWSDPSSLSAIAKSAPRPATRRPTFSQIVSTHSEKHNNNKRLVVVISDDESPVAQLEVGIDAQLRTQLIAHINSYAEVLFRWQLLRQRAELIKSIQPQSTSSSEDYRLGVVRICPSCGKAVGSSDKEVCFSCKGRVSLPRCSFCRLPVKGLSRSCMECGHIVHIKCSPFPGRGCLTGCGCVCMEVTPHNGI